MKKKVILPLVLSSMLVLNVASAAGFQDIKNHWAKDAIGWAVNQGIVKGYADGTFKPDHTVTEAEFLVMLIRLFPNSKAEVDPLTAPGPSWADPYYAEAKTYNIPVNGGNDRDRPITRGLVARWIAGANGMNYDTKGAIAYLFDQGLSKGRTGMTYQGYDAGGVLTRAEAVVFLENTQEKAPSSSLMVRPASAEVNPDESKYQDPAPTGNAILGLSIGDSADTLESVLGQPARKDASVFGSEWWVYNQDPQNYTQVEVKNGTVVGIYSNNSSWAFKGIHTGSSAEDVKNALGYAASVSIPYGNAAFMLKNDDNDKLLFLIHQQPVIVYIDKFTRKVASFRFISVSGLLRGQFYNASYRYTKTDPALSLKMPEVTPEMNAANEKEIFDITNSYRLKNGLSGLTWNEAAAGIARAHDIDMRDNHYFDHKSPTTGLDPFQRMDQAGIEFTVAAENIAEGQADAADVTEGWMDSEGHRKNILTGALQTLGVGAVDNYYTQDFVTP
jgi:uncharacterized protein YkwD